MGRPEKAKLRKLTGSPNVLFPVGKEGGRLRSVSEAVKVGSVKSEFPFYYCRKCKREGIYNKCEICGEKTIKKYFCPICKKEIDGVTSGKIVCPLCGVDREYYIVTGYNNHLHSNCSTAGCLGVNQ